MCAYWAVIVGAPNLGTPPRVHTYLPPARAAVSCKVTSRVDILAVFGRSAPAEILNAVLHDREEKLLSCCR